RLGEPQGLFAVRIRRYRLVLHPRPAWNDSLHGRTDATLPAHGKVDVVTQPVELSVIGGFGLYAVLVGAEECTAENSFGPTSDPVTVADVGGRPVAFLPRHGRDHR